jgi:3-deoxy-manno-octulosonate cytidylyltransferase (CMP-KDO synthetase)
VYTVLIPARLASTRLPDKPLADIAGKPMVVRVAERAAQSGAALVVVAADDERIVQACRAHGVQALLTRSDHASGSDRLAEACAQLGLDGDAIVVNVQGDEPLIDPALVRHCAELLLARRDCAVSTAAHPITELADYLDPNVVKVVLDAAGRALYFSRAPLPWWRDGHAAGATALPSVPAPLRHLGLYAYRAGFLRRFPSLPPAPLEQCEALEQLRVLWHGERIAVHVAAGSTGPGVDTPADLARVRALFAAASAAGLAQGPASA